MHFLELERLLVQLGLLADTFEFPRGDVREIRVVAQRFALRRLAFFAEMPAARLPAVERVEREQFGELEIVGDAAGVLEALIHVVGRTGNGDVVPEFLAELWNLGSACWRLAS